MYVKSADAADTVWGNEQSGGMLLEGDGCDTVGMVRSQVVHSTREI